MSVALRARAGRPVPRRTLPARREYRALRSSLALFLLSAGALAIAFLTALLYLHFATAIAGDGYELHALTARRDELRREQELLEVQLRRLDTPTRLEAEAQRLGLRKAARVFVIDTGSIVAGSPGLPRVRPASVDSARGPLAEGGVVGAGSR